MAASRFVPSGAIGFCAEVGADVGFGRAEDGLGLEPAPRESAFCAGLGFEPAGRLDWAFFDGAFFDWAFFDGGFAGFDFEIDPEAGLRFVDFRFEAAADVGLRCEEGLAAGLRLAEEAEADFRLAPEPDGFRFDEDFFLAMLASVCPRSVRRVASRP